MRKTKEYKELWSCRIGTRNIGTHFIEALDVMNQPAAPAFGKNFDPLQMPGMDPETNVKIGDIEVPGTEKE